MGRRFIQGTESVKQNIPMRHKEKKGRKKSRNKAKENQSVSQPPIFIRQSKDDGSTTLSILAPGDGLVPGTEKDRPISLGNLIGRVRVGTSYLVGFREDKRNIVKAMYPINYNFFSSYGPSYDSTFSNLTLEETQLVQTGVRFNKQTEEYADIIRTVSLEDYTHTFVDHLINILEGGADDKEEERMAGNEKDEERMEENEKEEVMMEVEEAQIEKEKDCEEMKDLAQTVEIDEDGKKKEITVENSAKPIENGVNGEEPVNGKEEDNEKKTNENDENKIETVEPTKQDLELANQNESQKNVSENEEIDFEGIRSLSADGIDISFLENLQTAYEARNLPKPAATVNERLQLTAELLENLKNCQSSRLAVCPASNLNQVLSPSEFEMRLAGQVLDNLTTILQHTEPGQVVNVASIRQAMGVNFSSSTVENS